VDHCPAGALTRGPEGAICFDETKCVQCDTCIHICPHDSSPRTHLMTAQEVYAEVCRQVPFIRGLTVSGGECMLQAEFMKELFTLAKADGLSAMIDSNGTIPFWEHTDLLEVTDSVMLDIKAFDTNDHRRITDEGNEIVLKNAEYLAQNGKLFEVRCVIVPDLYDTEKSIRDMADYLAPLLKLQKFRIKLIAYRPMGVREAYSHYTVPNDAYLESLAAILRDCGFEDIVKI
jgi:pyruvate formate lyase activating enzyme